MNNLNNHYKVNYNIFAKEDDISYYLLGAYMSDGCISLRDDGSKAFGINSIDLDWIESIRNVLCPDKPIYSCKNRNLHNLVLNDKKSVDWLISYGCIPNKSLTLNVLKEIPKEYQKDFIRGLIDGDGCISHYTHKRKDRVAIQNKKIVYLCSASLKMIEQIKELIPPEINCNIFTEIKLKNSIINGRQLPPSTLHRLTFNSINANKIINYIYYDGHRISLQRKFLKAKELIALPIQKSGRKSLKPA